jgi:hypothetical protein
LSLSRLAASGGRTPLPYALPPTRRRQRTGSSTKARVAFNRKDFVAASRKLELLDALFDANWTLQGGDQPDLRWRELTLMHLRFEPERALKVASRITDPYVLASMRVDQRFASLWSATSGRLGTCMSIFVR